jgi:predicted nucleic acid-binding protein
MEWVTKLHGTIVGLDTAPLIYFIEKNPIYLAIVRSFFLAVEHGDIQVVTSTLSLTEVLVHPYKFGNRSLAQMYFDILQHQRNLTTLPVSAEIATEAARLRAAYGLKTPDSIQIATAIVGRATSFLTNDGEFAPIPGLKIVCLSELLKFV